MDQASATAAEVTGSMMRLKLELDEKKRTVTMLQTALVSLFLCIWVALKIKTDTCSDVGVHGFSKYIKIEHTAGDTTLTCRSVPVDSAERADTPSCQGD